MVRDKDGQTPPVVQQFLVDLLAYNDNLGNPVRLFAHCSPRVPTDPERSPQYSDTYYITSVMNALGDRKSVV